MFVLTTKSGKTLVEGKDVANFDEIPADTSITSAQLLMPHKIYKKIGTKTLQRNAVISLGRYDYYYICKQAIANVMSINNTSVLPIAGQGTVTHEILAGISDNEVIYIKLALNTGDVVVEKFNLDWWIKQYGINPASFKKGSPKE